MQKVSVIIPTYNRAKHIKNTLNSVLTQTYQFFEIIIVDDGSTDNTRKIVESYIAKYPGKIKYFYQRNMGPAAARNKAILESSGEFIAFLDSDDTWIKTKLSEQVEILNHNLDVCLVFTDMSRLINSKIEQVSSLRYYNCYNSIFSDNTLLALSHKLFIFTPTVMIRRSIIPIVGLFNTEYRVGEDWEYWLRIAKQFKISFVDKSLVVRNIHDANTPKYLYYTGVVELLKKFIADRQFDTVQKKIFRRNLHESQFELGYFYFSRGEFKKSIIWFWRSLLIGHTIKPCLYIIVSIFPDRLIKGFKNIKHRINRFLPMRNLLKNVQS